MAPFSSAEGSAAQLRAICHAPVFCPHLTRATPHIIKSRSTPLPKRFSLARFACEASINLAANSIVRMSASQGSQFHRDKGELGMFTIWPYSASRREKKDLSRRIFLEAASGAAAVGLLAACAPVSTPASDSSDMEGDAPDEMVAELEMWTEMATVPWLGAMDEIVERFNGANPGIQVTHSGFSGLAYGRRPRPLLPVAQCQIACRPMPGRACAPPSSRQTSSWT